MIKKKNYRLILPIKKKKRYALSLFKPENTPSTLFFFLQFIWWRTQEVRPGVGHCLNFANGSSRVHPTCFPVHGIPYKLEGGFIILLGINKSGNQNFFPLFPHPKGRSLSTQVQSQPFGAHHSFQTFIFSYQLVPLTEMPTLLLLPRKQLLHL